MKAKYLTRHLLAVGLLIAQVVNADPFYRYIRIPQKNVTPEMVRQTGFIRDHVWDDTYAFGYVKKDTRALPNDSVELDAWDFATHDYDPKTLVIRPSERVEGLGPIEEFHTYQTLTDELQELAGKYPALMKLESAGRSVDGKELWYVRLTGSQLKDANKPKVLYISSMHGDEVTGKEMVYLIRDLLSGYGTDARLTSLMNAAEIWIMPSMNPDGTERHQRFNANGVDLNRNFPDLNEPAFSTSGRAPETLALMQLHKNNHFQIAMNFHGGSLCVNIPWDSKANPEGDKFGDDNLMMHLAHKYADNNGPMHNITQGSFVNGITYGYEWYQVLGGMQDWAAFFRQSTHSTLEISTTKWPSASQLPRFWNDNRESLLSYLEGGVIGVHAKVLDTTGKGIPNVDVDISTANRTLRYETGVVHRPTVPGSQQVTFTADGYRPVTVAIESSLFDGKYQTVTLQKN